MRGWYVGGCLSKTEPLTRPSHITNSGRALHTKPPLVGQAGAIRLPRAEVGLSHLISDVRLNR